MSDAALGYLAAAGAIACFGSMGLFLKGPRTARSKASPIVFGAYHSLSIFATSWLVLAWEDFVFTPYGIAASCLWVPAMLCALFSLKFLPISAAQPLWGGGSILVSFIWGAGIFQSETRSLGLAILGVAIMMLGLALLATNQSPVAIVLHSWLGCRPTADASSVDDAEAGTSTTVAATIEKTATSTSDAAPVPPVAPRPSKSAKSASVKRASKSSAKTSSKARAAGSSASASSPAVVVEERSMASSSEHYAPAAANSAKATKRASTKRASKSSTRKASAKSAKAPASDSSSQASAPPGAKRTSSKLPRKKMQAAKRARAPSASSNQSEQEETTVSDVRTSRNSSNDKSDASASSALPVSRPRSKMLMIAIGVGFSVVTALMNGSMFVPLKRTPKSSSGIVFVASFGIGVLPVAWFFFLIELAWTGLVHRTWPEMSFRDMFPSAFVGGICWSAGNYCAIYATLLLDLTVGFPLTQLNLVWACFLGWLWFKELSGRWVWHMLVSVALVLVGGGLLVVFGSPS